MRKNEDSEVELRLYSYRSDKVIYRNLTKSKLAKIIEILKEDEDNYEEIGV